MKKPKMKPVLCTYCPATVNVQVYKGEESQPSGWNWLIYPGTQTKHWLCPSCTAKLRRKEGGDHGHDH